MIQPPNLDWLTKSVGVHSTFFGQLYPLCGTAGSASAVWPSANLALYIPLYLRQYATVRSVWWGNGTAVSGNVDMGIYTEAGKQLYHTGSTAQAGTSTPQSVSVTNLSLPAGRYWMAIALDNGTGALSRWTNGGGMNSFQKMLGMQQQASAFALPATATFAACSNAYIPLIGLALTTDTY